LQQAVLHSFWRRRIGRLNQLRGFTYPTVHLRDLLESGFEVAMIRDASAATRKEDGDGYPSCSGRPGSR
jgi:hypothetical protein